VGLERHRVGFAGDLRGGDGMAIYQIRLGSLRDQSPRFVGDLMTLCLTHTNCRKVSKI
jgi:hypothetical protein